MRAAENTAAVAGNVISKSHSVSNICLPKENPENESKVAHTPQNIGASVVYIQHNPHSDARVTNVMQGREVNVMDEISQKVMQKQHMAPEHVVYVPQKTFEDEAKAPNEIHGLPRYTNTASERIVYVQPNLPEGNIISVTATPEPNTTQESTIYVSHNMPENMTATKYDPDQTPVRVIYVPHIPEGNLNQQFGLPGVIIHDPNNMQGHVQYATHTNVANPTPPPYNSQGHFQYVQNIQNRTPSPSKSLGHFQYAPHNMPNGMPAPNRIQGRSTEVLNQVVNIASKLALQHQNKKPENVYTAQPMATPVVYSPCVMGDGTGFMPQMQYQSPYMPQPVLAPAYNMQPTNQLPYIPPISQPVQNGLYMSSPPVAAAQGPLVPDYLPSQPVEPDVSNAGTQFFDNMDTNAGNEDCCSWYDCCCCLFSCCNNE